MAATVLCFVRLMELLFWIVHLIICCLTSAQRRCTFQGARAHVCPLPKSSSLLWGFCYCLLVLKVTLGERLLPVQLPLLWDSSLQLSAITVNLHSALSCLPWCDCLSLILHSLILDRRNLFCCAELACIFLMVAD